jgi:competence protein ComEA
MLKKLGKEKKIMFTIAIILGIIFIIKIIDNNYQKQDNQNIETGIIQVENPKEEQDIEEKIVIYITGEVKKEGVIELKLGSRIADAIEKAEGLTENANIKNVNLAYELEDGQKIYIPNKNEEQTIITENSGITVNENKEQNQTININKADSDELQNLNGIGKSLAGTIIKYREENGKFKKIEELMNVPGIGESKFNNIKDKIKVK